MAKKKGGDHGGGGGHDGGGSLRWLLTYADMITLLMAFFIMVYSMSVLDLAKFRKLSDAVKSGFGGPVQGGGGGPNYMSTSSGSNAKPAIIPEIMIVETTTIVDQVSKYVKAHDLEGEVGVKSTRRGVVVSIVTDKLLFPSGSAEIMAGSDSLIRSLSKVLADSGRQVRIEGHTDSVPISTGQYPSNWELSAARATTVVRYLIDKCGVPASRLSASGYADTRPVKRNSSEASRRFNRRVDLVMLNTGEADE